MRKFASCTHAISSSIANILLSFQFCLLVILRDAIGKMKNWTKKKSLFQWDAPIFGSKWGFHSKKKIPLGYKFAFDFLSFFHLYIQSITDVFTFSIIYLNEFNEFQCSRFIQHFRSKNSHGFLLRWISLRFISKANNKKKSLAAHGLWPHRTYIYIEKKWETRIFW